MATKSLSDADILGGDDEDTGVLLGAGETQEDDSLDALSDGGAELDTGGLEVEVLEQDEGEEQDKAAQTDDDKGRGDGPDSADDAGEVVDVDGLTEWDKKNLSKSVQKRISREQRLKVAEREAREAAEDRARKSEAGLLQARKETLEAQKLSANLMAASLDGQIAANTEALIAAKENSDSKEEVKAQSELDDLRAKRRELEGYRARLEATKIELPAAEHDVPEGTKTWLRNNKWFSNPQFADDAAILKTLDTRLGDEFKAGRFAHAPGTTQYFIELDRRVHAKLPNLRAEIRRAYPIPQAQTQRHAPVVNRGSAVRQSSAGKVLITPQDKENMRTFGLDPNNKSHLQEYARSKAGKGALNG
jgi:hypothetical protein